MKPRTLLVFPDVHAAPKGSVEGGLDPKAVSVFMQAIPIVKPDECVGLGDIGEWESVCRHRWANRPMPSYEWLKPLLDKDVAAVNGFLDQLEKNLDKAKCGKVTIIEGNHEVWCNDYAEREARPELTSKRLMKIDERGWDWSEYGEFRKFGKLWMTHGGHFNGLHHAYKTVLGLSASCVYGHFHNVESAHVMHLGGQHGAWALGCLCKLRKKFLKGRPTAWSHAFGIVHIESDGTFHVEVVDIFDGVGYVYGKRLEAK